MIKFKSLREAKVKASDYNATSEKSKFGGHRANIVHKTKKGDVLYTGKVSFKTPKAAKAAADSYLSGYAIGGEKGADKMMNAHIKNNKKNLVDTSVLDTMESVDEALVEGASDKIAKQMVVLNTKIDQIRGDIQSTEAAHRDNDIDNAKFKKLDNEHNKRLSKAEAELDKLFARFKSVKESIDLDELHGEAVELDEAFKRIPGNMINGELPRAAKDLESVLRGLKAGNDFDEKAFNKVLAALNNVKKSAKSFKSEDDVTLPYKYRADPRYKNK
jgi:hypothetical protein